MRLLKNCAFGTHKIEAVTPGIIIIATMGAIIALALMGMEAPYLLYIVFFVGALVL